MKKLGIALLSLGAVSFACAASNNIVNNLAGTYTCQGYDIHDGGYQNAKLEITLDKKNSQSENGFGAYKIKLSEPDGTMYTGEAASSGNSVAIYFENTKATELTDRGVGIATITHDKDVTGKVETVLHKFYYEPTYENGGNGSETCVKE